MDAVRSTGKKKTAVFGIAAMALCFAWGAWAQDPADLDDPVDLEDTLDLVDVDDPADSTDLVVVDDPADSTDLVDVDDPADSTDLVVVDDPADSTVDAEVDPERREHGQVLVGQADCGVRQGHLGDQGGGC